MTAAEVAISSRRAQGLADRVTDDQALDAIAALLASTAAGVEGTNRGGD